MPLPLLSRTPLATTVRSVVAMLLESTITAFCASETNTLMLFPPSRSFHQLGRRRSEACIACWISWLWPAASVKQNFCRIPIICWTVFTDDWVSFIALISMTRSETSVTSPTPASRHAGEVGDIPAVAVPDGAVHGRADTVVERDIHREISPLRADACGSSRMAARAQVRAPRSPSPAVEPERNAR